MRELNLITSNPGKLREYRELLSERFHVNMKSLEYPEIQADTLEEVVCHALEGLQEYSPVIIDDSGLFIDALKGFPGVYSAYVMDTLGCDGILKLMEQENDRKANFRCVVGLLDEEIEIFTGDCPGEIVRSKRGTGGFGYDPIFVPSGYDHTFAEMSVQEKNLVSHRGRAMRALIKHISFTRI